MKEGMRVLSRDRGEYSGYTKCLLSLSSVWVCVDIIEKAHNFYTTQKALLSFKKTWRKNMGRGLWPDMMAWLPSSSAKH